MEMADNNIPQDGPISNSDFPSGIETFEILN